MPKQDWKKTRTIYWSDESNDDFNDLGNKRPPVPEDYNYIRSNWFVNAIFWVLYNLLAKPIFAIYCFFHGIRFKNKKNLRLLKGSGAYIYSNHVAISDVFKFQANPFFFKRMVNILGYSDSLSIPVARHLVKGLGYLPVPLKGDVKNTLKLNLACEHYIKKKQFILIYPEAHIWPYYTKIRDFSAGSFSYAAKQLAPIVPAVTTWRKPLIGKKPKQTVYICEPIFPKKEFNTAQNIRYLHDECLRAMRDVANADPQYEYIKYIYQPKEDNHDSEK